MDLNERLILKKEINRIYMPIIREKAIKSIRNDIVNITIQEGVKITPEVILDCYVELIEESSKNQETTVYIFHVDQSELHIHSMYVIGDDHRPKW